MVLEALITNAPLGHDSNNKHGGEQSAAGIGPTQSSQANKITWIKHADSLTRMIWRLCVCLSQPLITIHVVNESPSVEPRRLVGVFCLGWSTSFLLLQLWRSIHMLTVAICEKETVPTKTVCVQIPLCMLSLHHSPHLPVCFYLFIFFAVLQTSQTHIIAHYVGMLGLRHVCVIDGNCEGIGWKETIQSALKEVWPHRAWIGWKRMQNLGLKLCIQGILIAEKITFGSMHDFIQE